MGPVSRYLGPWVPEPQLWQDPVPAVDHELIDDADVAALKETILALGPVRSRGWSPPPGRRRRRSAAPTCAAGRTGRASASRRRRTGRSTSPAELAGGAPGRSSRSSRTSTLAAGGKRVSLADVIVLGGCAAVEQAAKAAGHDVTVPFAPGRTDASQEQTDVDSFAVLEPRSDGFRNYFRAGRAAPAGARAAGARLHADADGARDDGPDRRPAGAGRQRRTARRTASSPTGPGR